MDNSPYRVFMVKSHLVLLCLLVFLAPFGIQAQEAGGRSTSRLQAAAAPGEVVVSGATRDAIGDDAEVEPIDAIDAKGKREPVRAYRLVGLRGR